MGMQVSDKLRCGSRIASGLLDALAASGDVAGMARVRRVYSDDRVNVRAEGSWVARRTIDRAFRALGSDRNFARRVGYALVATERIGFFLFTEGVATIEKAYRRCEPLLAREDREGRFETLEVGDRYARIAYFPGKGVDDGTAKTDSPQWNTNFCAVREGMLEALPLSFGLLPAKVEESQCVGQGASHCCFEVRFESSSNLGAFFGLGVGAVVAVGLCVLALPGIALWLQGLVGGIITVLSAAAGHSFDLAKQLKAVAGARRGHLALLEQADSALAEKMDELAKVGAHLDGTRGDNTDRLRAILEERSERDHEPSDADDAASVACDEDDPPQVCEPGPEPGHASESDDAASENAHKPMQLAEILTRAADSVRSALQADQQLVLDIEDGLPLVRCEPFQIEQVAYQLLKNAAEASPPDGKIRAELRNTPEGIELTVEDRGDGIPEDVLDQVFDPFTFDGSVGDESGLGLAICYRIVVEHGGEMRLASEICEGTRVTVVLPADPHGPEMG